MLSLDVDAVLLTDIYALLRAPPLSAQDVIITRNSDGSQSLNCGFVYFNRDGSPDGAPKELEVASLVRVRIRVRVSLTLTLTLTLPLPLTLTLTCRPRRSARQSPPGRSTSHHARS